MADSPESLDNIISTKKQADQAVEESLKAVILATQALADAKAAREAVYAAAEAADCQAEARKLSKQPEVDPLTKGEFFAKLDSDTQADHLSSGSPVIRKHKRRIRKVVRRWAMIAAIVVLGAALVVLMIMALKSGGGVAAE